MSKNRGQAPSVSQFEQNPDAAWTEWRPRPGTASAHLGDLLTNTGNTPIPLKRDDIGCVTPTFTFRVNASKIKVMGGQATIAVHAWRNGVFYDEGLVAAWRPSEEGVYTVALKEDCTNTGDDQTLRVTLRSAWIDGGRYPSYEESGVIAQARYNKGEIAMGSIVLAGIPGGPSSPSAPVDDIDEKPAVKVTKKTTMTLKVKKVSKKKAKVTATVKAGTASAPGAVKFFQKVKVKSKWKWKDLKTSRLKNGKATYTFKNLKKNTKIKVEFAQTVQGNTTYKASRKSITVK